MTDMLVRDGVGSTDWAGEHAQEGGSHTGTCYVSMRSGAVFRVAHTVNEVLRKMDLHAVAQTVPTWVAFDRPLAAIPVVLNVSEITGTSATPPAPLP